MAQPEDQQNNPSSVVDALHNEHERTPRFIDNLSKRPGDCAPNTSFETKWAFNAAETKRIDVEKKTSGHLTSATMTLSFALQEIKDEITEIDTLLRGIDVRENELESMFNSLEKMCLTLAARDLERKRLAEEASSSSGEPGVVLGSGGGVRLGNGQDVVLGSGEGARLGTAEGAVLGARGTDSEEADMRTAEKQETTMTGPSSNVSTADEISTAEQLPSPATTVLLGQVTPAASPSTHDHDISNISTPTTTAHEIPPARSSSHFDYSALSAYTPQQQRTPCKIDSTVTCPGVSAPNSPSSGRSLHERRA